MQRLTEMAIEKAAPGIFTLTEVAAWLGGSSDRQFSSISRAVTAGEVVRVRRGLYCLAARYLSDKVDPLALAQRLYGPSYLSLETAPACPPCPT